MDGGSVHQKYYYMSDNITWEKRGYFMMAIPRLCHVMPWQYINHGGPELARNVWYG